MTKVLDEYEKADGARRAELESKYGKATLQRHLVEYQSMRYVKGHSQACPYCRSLISKIDGYVQIRLPRDEQLYETGATRCFAGSATGPSAGSAFQS